MNIRNFSEDHFKRTKASEAQTVAIFERLCASWNLIIGWRKKESEPFFPQAPLDDESLRGLSRQFDKITRFWEIPECFDTLNEKMDTSFSKILPTR